MKRRMLRKLIDNWPFPWLGGALYAEGPVKRVTRKGGGQAMRALITGITGQDGSYLAESLLADGYEVHGILRRSSSFNTGRIDGIFDRLHLHRADMTDAGSLHRVIRAVRPTECYNLAAQSHVGDSFLIPDYTHATNAVGAAVLFEAIADLAPTCRIYQASTSELFGNSMPPQNESTTFQPCSPYAIAKLSAHLTARMFRESRGLHISCGILFNHESPRRGETFVTRKVARAVAAIQRGEADHVTLGNLGAKRDWGYAPEYVEAMRLMVARSHPGDYAIATGESHSVGELCVEAFGVAGLDWRKYVRSDPAYERPAEVFHLQGDPSLAERHLGWKAKTRFKELVRIMVQAEMDGGGR